jgi:hypothetical protein
VIKGITSEAGLRDYPVLLSLCETCDYQSLDFLDFLRSGQTDIAVFADSRQKKIFIERKRLERAAELFNEGRELQEVTKEVVGIDGCTFELAENCVRESRTHRQDRRTVNLCFTRRLLLSSATIPPSMTASWNI